MRIIGSADLPVARDTSCADSSGSTVGSAITADRSAASGMAVVKCVIAMK